jgi:hypothetical protein
MEFWEAADYFDADLAYERLSELMKRHRLDIPAPPVVAAGASVASLGYRAPQEPTDGAVISPLQQQRPETADRRLRVVHSFGIRSPFADGEFETVVVSPYWRWLLFRLSPGREPVAWYVLNEAARIGRAVIVTGLAGAAPTERLQLLACARTIPRRLRLIND